MAVERNGAHSPLLKSIVLKTYNKHVFFPFPSKEVNIQAQDPKPTTPKCNVFGLERH